MKLIFNGQDHKVVEGECNLWVTFDPIIPTMKSNQNLMTVGSSTSVALDVVKQTGVHSDFTSTGPGDYAETAIREVLGEYTPRSTYDRYVLQPGDVLLLVSKTDVGIVCDFMFIVEKNDE